MAMIATTSASNDPVIILDVASSNWAAYRKQSDRLFQTKFGRIGASIISGIRPVAFVLPTRHDVDATGSCIFHHLLPSEPQTAPNAVPNLTTFGARGRMPEIFDAPMRPNLV